MSFPVIFREEASREVEEVRDYLDSEQEGLGITFLLRLQDVLIQLGEHPEMYGRVWRNVRAARIRQFHYVVYYRFESECVEILGIAHGYRDYSEWKERL